MATVNEVNVIVNEINDATNGVASKIEEQTAEIERLRELVANGDGVTPEDLDAVAASLRPISERLRAIASDVTNPVPPEA